MRPLIIVLVAIAGIVVGLGMASSRGNRPSVPRVEAALRTAGVSIGTPETRLLTVLDSLHVQHATLPGTGLVTANFGRSADYLVFHHAVYGLFQMGMDGRLLGHTIKETYALPFSRSDIGPRFVSSSKRPAPK